MFVKKSMLFIVLLGMLLFRTAHAQFPNDLLPASHQELADTAAQLRADMLSLASLDSLTAILDSLLALKADTSQTNALAAKADTVEIDSLKFYYGEAGDTTSPGYFYYLNPADSTWHRADTLASVVARGVAVDSVNKGAVCRYQFTGLFMDADYDDLIIPGQKVVSDSVTAGWLCPIDTARTNTKKMQGYGVAVDSVTISLDIDPWVWIWEN